MSQIRKAKEAFNNGDYQTSLNVVNNLIIKDDGDTEALMLRSLIAQKKENWSEAINDLNKILEVDENHSQAISTKSMIVEILKFRNTDLYNP